LRIKVVNYAAMRWFGTHGCISYNMHGKFVSLDVRINYMETLKRIAVVVILVSMCVLGTDVAQARGHHGGHTSVFIGVGYGYPYHYGYGYWPHHYHHYGYYDLWGDDYYTEVIVERPVVMVERPVVQMRTAEVSGNTSNLFASIRAKKAELLRQLQIGDEASRKNAIGELAGLSYDDTVRGAMEEILLKDPNADLRKEVAKAFGKVRNEKTIPALEAVRVGDSEIGVRQEADAAIREIKKSSP